jgi:subtilisin family serine protease
MDWVRTHAIKPAVANMSLGGGSSAALNSAANNLANAGVFLAVAAGNSNANACSSSPSGASAAFAVAASSSTDTRASFSNFGSCVKVYAPGVSVTSDWLSGGTNTISGTSMASPHVAGVAALYKSNFGDASSATVGAWITSNATTNVIKSNPSGTPNRLLYKSTL